MIGAIVVIGLSVTFVTESFVNSRVSALESSAAVSVYWGNTPEMQGIQDTPELAGTAPSEPLISPDIKAMVPGGAVKERDSYLKQLEDLDAKIKKMREDAGSTDPSARRALADEEFKLWDRERKTIYNAILEQSDEEAREAWSASQQAWLKSRDQRAEEAAKNHSTEGLEELFYTLSLAEFTRERAYALAGEYSEIAVVKEGP